MTERIYAYLPELLHCNVTLNTDLFTNKSLFYMVNNFTTCHSLCMDLNLFNLFTKLKILLQECTNYHQKTKTRFTVAARISGYPDRKDSHSAVQSVRCLCFACNNLKAFPIKFSWVNVQRFEFMADWIEDPSVVRNEISHWLDIYSAPPNKISLWFADSIPATNCVVQRCLDLTLLLWRWRQQVPLKHRCVLENKTNIVQLIRIHTFLIQTPQHVSAYRTHSGISFNTIRWHTRLLLTMPTIIEACKGVRIKYKTPYVTTSHRVVYILPNAYTKRLYEQFFLAKVQSARSQMHISLFTGPKWKFTISFRNSEYFENNQSGMFQRKYSLIDVQQFWLPPVAEISKVFNDESFTDQSTEQLMLTDILKMKSGPTIACDAERVLREFS